MCFSSPIPGTDPCCIESVNICTAPIQKPVNLTTNRGLRVEWERYSEQN